MKIKRGLYKRVFIFKNFVVKTPIDFNGVKAILSEQYGYITVDKDKRHMLLKIYFIPLIPLSIQRKVDICLDSDWDKIREEFSFNNCKRYEVFTDLKPNNFGYYKGKLVKIDYDFIYYWYNKKVDIFGLDIKNIEMKLYKCLWKKLKEFFNK
ncbi:MAG: hypothetical protein ACRC1T_09325 [Clostridium chrysemydis]|uniref:hypothetical protein n=1 Tax=Clostridium chrysemydis TaxID=2665504 RepID=UPI003F3F44B2